MDLWQSMTEMLELELVTADPATRLAQVNEKGIALYRAEAVSEMKLRFMIRRSDFLLLKEMCESRGDAVAVVKTLGLLRLATALRKRGIFLMGMLLLLVATFLLPCRILFLKVEGNTKIADDQIIEAAEDCGLVFGTARREIRSEQIKNGLLERIPELKWAGVNTYGCVAVISVREEAPEKEEEKSAPVSNIVAIRDGVVLDCTATRGTLLCKPGQVVHAGEILVSGYTDCGRILRVTNAQGEVFAQTVRSVHALTPNQRTERGEVLDQKTKISLLVGKKRINLWKDSGIWDATCGRMYQEYVLTLPGGFCLPIAICVETHTRYEVDAMERNGEEASEELEAYVRTYLLRQMNAGQIVTSRFQITQGEGVLALEGNYVCTEMIGAIQPEQIGE